MKALKLNIFLYKAFTAQFQIKLFVYNLQNWNKIKGFREELNDHGAV